MQTITNSMLANLFTIAILILIIPPLIWGVIYYKQGNSLSFRIAVVFIGFAANAAVASLILQFINTTNPSSYIFVLIITIVFELVIIDALIYFIWKTIIQPLDQIAKFQTTLAKGNLSIELPNYSRKDEIGKKIEANAN